MPKIFSFIVKNTLQAFLSLLISTPSSESLNKYLYERLLNVVCTCNMP